jgi:hypothetical protein
MHLPQPRKGRRPTMRKKEQRKASAPPATAPLTGLYEVEGGTHDGFVALVARDRMGKVHLAATVTAEYYEWMVKRGHVAADSTRIEYYDVEAHGLPSHPLTMIPANRAAVERRSSAVLTLVGGASQ